MSAATSIRSHKSQKGDLAIIDFSIRLSNDGEWTIASTTTSITEDQLKDYLDLGVLLEPVKQADSGSKDGGSRSRSRSRSVSRSRRRGSSASYFSEPSIAHDSTSDLQLQRSRSRDRQGSRSRYWSRSRDHRGSRFRYYDHPEIPIVDYGGGQNPSDDRDEGVKHEDVQRENKTALDERRRSRSMESIVRAATDGINAYIDAKKGNRLPSPPHVANEDGTAPALERRRSRSRDSRQGPALDEGKEEKPSASQSVRENDVAFQSIRDSDTAVLDDPQRGSKERDHGTRDDRSRNRDRGRTQDDRSRTRDDRSRTRDDRSRTWDDRDEQRTWDDTRRTRQTSDETFNGRFIRISFTRPFSEVLAEILPQIDLQKQEYRSKIPSSGNLCVDWTSSSMLGMPFAICGSPMGGDGPSMTFGLTLMNPADKEESPVTRSFTRRRSRETTNSKPSLPPQLFGFVFTDHDEFALQSILDSIPETLKLHFPSRWSGRYERKRKQSHVGSHPKQAISEVLLNHVVFHMMRAYVLDLRERLDATIIYMSEAEKQMAQPNADLTALRQSLNTCQRRWRRLENYNYRFARQALKDIEEDLPEDGSDFNFKWLNDMLHSWKEESKRFEEDSEALQRNLTDAVSERQQDLSNELAQTSLELTKASLQLAQAAQKDSRSMRAIAYATLSFLPATFITSFFSMCFFNSGGEGAVFDDSYHHLWIYFVIAIPTTLLVLWIFRAWEKAEFKKEVDGAAAERQLSFRRATSFKYIGGEKGMM